MDYRRGSLITSASDYEQGTWTPALAGGTVAGTQTYALRAGRYVKIGPLVWVSGIVILSALDGSTSGAMLITGLPFTASAIAGLTAPISVDNFQNIVLNTAGGYYFPEVSVQQNATHLNLAQSVARAVCVGRHGVEYRLGPHGLDGSGSFRISGNGRAVRV